MPIEQLTYAHPAERLCEQPDLAASGGRRARQRVAAYVAVAKLMQRFPAAFARSGPRKPLKLGIDDDLVAAGFTRSEISGGLGFYCNNYRYLIAMARAPFALTSRAGRPAL